MTESQLKRIYSDINLGIIAHTSQDALYLKSCKNCLNRIIKYIRTSNKIDITDEDILSDDDKLEEFTTIIEDLDSEGKIPNFMKRKIASSYGKTDWLSEVLSMIPRELPNINNSDDDSQMELEYTYNRERDSLFI